MGPLERCLEQRGQQGTHCSPAATLYESRPSFPSRLCTMGGEAGLLVLRGSLAMPSIPNEELCPSLLPHRPAFSQGYLWDPQDGHRTLPTRWSGMAAALVRKGIGRAMVNPGFHQHTSQTLNPRWFCCSPRLEMFRMLQLRNSLGSQSSSQPPEQKNGLQSSPPSLGPQSSGWSPVNATCACVCVCVSVHMCVWWEWWDECLKPF